jgi:hypothetical protein
MYERGLAMAREIGDRGNTAGLLNNVANKASAGGTRP